MKNILLFQGPRALFKDIFVINLVIHSTLFYRRIQLWVHQIILLQRFYSRKVMVWNVTGKPLKNSDEATLSLINVL
mgnify:FL=1